MRNLPQRVLELGPTWWGAAAGAAAAGAVIFPDARVLAAVGGAAAVLAIALLQPPCGCHDEPAPAPAPAMAKAAPEETWAELLGPGNSGVPGATVGPSAKGCGCP